MTMSSSGGGRTTVLSLFFQLTLLTAKLIQIIHAQQQQSPVTYTSTPTTIWNQAIQTEPRQNNGISISPDNSWIYVTSVSRGTLSKLNPNNGLFVNYYNKLGLEAEGAGRFVYGESGVEYYVNDNDEEGNEGDDGSYLIYWVLDVSSKGSYSKVVCVKHDPNPNSKTIEVKWVKSLAGILNGMPKIGSDGKLIYLTINADRGTPIANDTSTTDSTTTDTVSNTDTTTTDVDEGTSPSDEPPPSDLFEPTDIPYWYLDFDSDNNLICNVGVGNTEITINGTVTTIPTFDSRDECCEAQPSACPVATPAPTPAPTSVATEIATTVVEGGIRRKGRRVATVVDPNNAEDNDSRRTATTLSRRKLQAPQKTGRFIILNAANGKVVYSFDSRDDFTIRKHEFSPVGIAHNPAYGNYDGGAGNTNDVVMWGSGIGIGQEADANVGETLLFQLPKGFNADLLSSSSMDVTSQFKTQVMESVPWTTQIPPTFSKDGLEVYFLISGSRLTGWNNGQKFDIAPNVGPVALSSDSKDSAIQRPLVLVDDDKTVLVGVENTMHAVDVSRAPASMWWSRTFGSGAAFTEPQITPDGSFAYFGKNGTIHALNLTNGALLFGEGGYFDPFSTPSKVTMADFTIDNFGQTLYYSRGGSDTVTALKIGEVTPTDPPTPTPSMSPSVTSSTAPSTSVAPSVSTKPSYSANYIFPSMKPSQSPSNVPSESPSKSPTLKPQVEPTEPAFVYPGTPTTTMPTFDGAANPPSLASAKDNGNTSTSPLSMPAIIGIAVGGGVGLFLILGSLCYVCRKKPCKGGGEDDGLDTDWQASNAPQQFQGGGSGDDQTPFQYGDEESDGGGQQKYGEPLKW